MLLWYNANDYKLYIKLAKPFVEGTTYICHIEIKALNSDWYISKSINTTNNELGNIRSKYKTAKTQFYLWNTKTDIQNMRIFVLYIIKMHFLRIFKQGKV